MLEGSNVIFEPQTSYNLQNEFFCFQHVQTSQTFVFPSYRGSTKIYLIQNNINDSPTLPHPLHPLRAPVTPAPVGTAFSI